MMIRLIGRVVLVWSTFLVDGPLFLLGGVFAGENAGVPVETADDLVRAALAAELTGDSPRRDRLLHEALLLCPDHAAARGHLGMIRGEDGWRTVDDLIDANRSDERLGRYESLRTRLGLSPAGHLQLARYCTRHDLPVRARFHWYGVLDARPDHTAAMRALGLKRFRGALLTEQQIERVREQEKLVDHWRPRLESWAESIRDRKDGWEDALRQLREIRDPRLIGMLSSLISPASETCAAEVARILSRIDSRESDYHLVLHAVDSPHASVRSAAIDALRDRSIFRVVPPLMGELGMHVGFAVQHFDDFTASAVAQFEVERPDGLFVHRDLFRAPLKRDVSTVISRISRDSGMKDRVAGDAVARLDTARASDDRQDSVGRWHRHIDAQTRQQDRNLEVINTAIDVRNRRVIVALTAVTGRDLGENPRAWWSWWLDYNHYGFDFLPTFESLTVHTTGPAIRHAEIQQTEYNEPSPSDGTSPYLKDYAFYSPRRPRYRFRGIVPLSCFAAGTPVTTDLGPKPIEQLRVGDRVLTRDVETGEAGFELVARTTRRQASKMRGIQLDGEELLATAGHPFWVVGRGWRMAHELQPGDRLHALSGSLEVREVREASPQTVYNLVVGADARRRNYFVGHGRVLAHDATLRDPTDRPLPGCAPLETAIAR